MGLFSKKQNSEPKAGAAPAQVAHAPKRPAPAKAKKKTTDARMSSVLIAPWFSEKALVGTEKGVYVFSVPESATKQEVKDAIEKFYKVTPRKVSLLHLPGKKKALRSRRGIGTRARRHKAYVYLKKGEAITFT